MMKFLLYSCLVTGFLFGCQENNIPEIIDPLPVKDTSNMVLFIGNSYTYYNDGVDYHLEQLVLADTTVDSVSYVIKSLAPVGRAWEYVKTTHQEINLYSSDDKHPSLSGTYLTSCIFEIVLFGMDPRASDYVPYGITSITAAKLRTAAFDYMISLEA